MDRNRRRKFGQNFLVNPVTIQAIADDLPIKSSEQILEIGPGHGSLTEPLLEKCKRLTAIEIDEKCIKHLRFKIKNPDFHIIHKNFLDFDFASFVRKHKDVWVAGNLPYNVGTPILIKILPHIAEINGVMAMLQMEVAKRMAAKPGTKEYGALSVIVQSHAHCKILRTISPTDFHPKPNVLSATILLTHNPDAPGGNLEYYNFVGTCFAQKRKKMYNTISKFYEKHKVKEALQKVGLSEDLRAEAIPANKFAKLYEILGNPKPNL
jgi:16S rRNA (adenine1518-N6/adenine1519-N6)-dimethyltransferase